MIVGNHHSDSVVLFKIDLNTRELTPTGTEFDLGPSVCFRFLKVKP
jgi:6-phosphogluconolactonase (cycloisomerase 2 family)